MIVLKEKIVYFDAVQKHELSDGDVLPVAPEEAHSVSVLENSEVLLYHKTAETEKCVRAA